MDGGRVGRKEGSRRILLSVIACNVVLAVAILSARSLGSVDPKDESTRAAAPQETDKPPPKPTSRLDDGDRPSSWGAEVVNDRGRYLFSRPTGWTVTQRDTVSKVSPADGEVMVSFGVGPRGGVDHAFDQLNAALEEGYDDVVVRIKDVEPVEGATVVTLEGTATTRGGTDIWLSGRLVDLPKAEPALVALGAGVLAAENGGRRNVDRILTSFRALDFEGWKSRDVIVHGVHAFENEEPEAGTILAVRTPTHDRGSQARV